RWRRELALCGLKDIAVVDLPGGTLQWRRTLPAQVEALTFGAGATMSLSACALYIVGTVVGAILSWSDANQWVGRPPPGGGRGGRKVPLPPLRSVYPPNSP